MNTGSLVYDVVHANAEFSDQLSDHDPTLLTMTLAPVPEPETYAMLLAGLALVGAAIRRRRQSCLTMMLQGLAPAASQRCPAGAGRLTVASQNAIWLTRPAATSTIAADSAGLAPSPTTALQAAPTAICEKP